MSDTVSAPVLRRGGPAHRRWKFFEGWLEHKSKQAKNYQLLWCVLVERTIHIFSNKEEKNENTVLGSLSIDETAKFRVTSADDRNGYKFELTTSNGLRNNRFKSKKKVEMEMWRGYILGLSKGMVPDDLDLLYSQVQQIKDDLDYYRQSDGSLYDNRRPVSEAPSGDSGIVDAKSHVTGNSGGTASTISGPGGGPVMRHKFTNNPAMDDKVPSWFFSYCTRDKAEKILVNAGSLGNTLMRESSSQKAQGSYVISKLSKMKGKPPTVEHFEVERIDRGYRIKVENKHEPMSNLTEVMNYFMFTAGVETTVPLKSNRLSTFGLVDDGDEDPYDLKKIEREIPSSSMELPEPLPGPGPSHLSLPRSPSPQTEQEFDAPAPGRETVYYNAEDEVWHLKKDKGGSSSSMPREQAPPTPHIPQGQGYYNERKKDEGQHPRAKSVPDIGTQIGGHKFGTGETIDLDKPVDPNQEPPASVIPQSSLAAALQGVKLRPTSTATQSPDSAPQGPKSPISPPGTSPAINKPKTPSHLVKATSVDSSPVVGDKVLTPQQMGLRPTPKREPAKQQSPTAPETDSPVDESHPGSVRSILGRFEQKPSTQQSPSTAPKPARGFSLGSNKASSETNITCNIKRTSQEVRNNSNNSRHSFGGISHKNQSPSFSSRSNPNLSTNNSTNSAFAVRAVKSSSNFSNAKLIEEDLYESPDFIEPINTSDEEEDDDDTYQDALSPPSVKPAMDSSFRRKLEQQLSSGSLPVNKQVFRKSSAGATQTVEDELYEELPELPAEEDT